MTAPEKISKEDALEYLLLNERAAHLKAQMQAAAMHRVQLDAQFREAAAEHNAFLIALRQKYELGDKPFSMKRDGSLTVGE